MRLPSPAPRASPPARAPSPRFAARAPHARAAHACRQRWPTFIAADRVQSRSVARPRRDGAGEGTIDGLRWRGVGLAKARMGWECVRNRSETRACSVGDSSGSALCAAIPFHSFSRHFGSVRLHGAVGWAQYTFGGAGLSSAAVACAIQTTTASTFRSTSPIAFL